MKARLMCLSCHKESPRSEWVRVSGEGGFYDLLHCPECGQLAMNIENRTEVPEKPIEVNHDEMAHYIQDRLFQEGTAVKYEDIVRVLDIEMEYYHHIGLFSKNNRRSS